MERRQRRVHSQGFRQRGHALVTDGIAVQIEPHQSRVHFQGFRQRGRALVADGIVFQVEPYVSAEIDFRKVLAPHALPRAGTVWATLGSPRALSRGSRPRSTPKL